MRTSTFVKVVKSVVAVIIFCVITMESKAQLTVSTAMTPAQLVQNVLVGTGVTVSNITYTGMAASIGRFSTGGTPTNLGLTTGIIMSTGLVNGTTPSSIPPAIGCAATNFESSVTNSASDVNLQALVTQTVSDACVLQFDFLPLADTIKFRYVFASEEYPEFVCSTFNDVFGFFVSGANPAGGNYVAKNIALIPGTTLPVAINSVNGGPGSGYTASGCISTAYGAYYTDNSSGTSIVFDGFTHVLTAWCRVIPCTNYHIKLAIGDGGDESYDSGVFLEANSFSTSAVSINTTYSSPNVSLTNAVEGCNDAIITFGLNNPLPTSYTITYTIAGTATNGVDYTTIPTSVTIPAGQTSTSLTIHPITDGLLEGTETVILTFQTSICGGTNTSTISILNNNPLTASSSNDTLICNGTANLTVFPVGGITPYTYLWSGGAGTTASVDVSPVTTTTYTVTVTDLCGATATESVLVTVGFSNANAGPDATICEGQSTILTASGGTTYLWSTNATTQSITVSPVNTTSYWVTAVDNCPTVDTVTVFVNPNPVLTFTPASASICLGTSISLACSGATTYVWTPSNTLSPATGTPVNATPTTNTTYTVVGTTLGCTGMNTVNVAINPNLVITVNPTAPAICVGNSIVLTSAGADTYVWTPSSTLSPATGAIVTAAPLLTTTYSVVGTNAAGCTGGTSVTVIATLGPVISITGNPNPMCIGDTSELICNGAAQIYTWSPSATLSNATGQITHAFPTVTTTYTVIGDNSGCISTAEYTLVVSPLPIIDFTADIFEGCQGLWVNFQDLTTPTVNQWYWTFGDNITYGGFSYLQNPSHYFENAGTYDVTLSAVSSAGCKMSLTKPGYIVTHPIPAADFSVTPDIVNELDALVWFTDQSSGATDWNWNFGELNLLGNTSSIENPTHVYADTGNYYPVLIVFSDYGCSDTAMRHVYVEPNFGFYAPNAFTPNDDEKNQVFAPKGEGINLETFEMRIYDRWGKQVFNSRNMAEGWDGKVEGKEPVEGVYNWYISFHDINRRYHAYKGNVILVK